MEAVQSIRRGEGSQTAWREQAVSGEPLKDLVDEVVLTQSDLPRAATAQELRASTGDLLPHPYVVPSLTEAMVLARELATPDGLVCVTGSLMLVGECKARFRGCGLSPLRG